MQCGLRNRTAALALCAVAAFTAATLGGCDTGYKFSISSKSTASVPSATATPAPGVSGSTTSVPPDVPLCAATDLAARGGRRQNPDGGAGAIGDVIFADPGATACELKGIPVLRLVRTSGTALAVQNATPLSSGLAPVVVQAHGKGTAEMVFTWDNWCGAAPGALELQIILAGGRGTVAAPLNGQLGDYVPGCSKRGAPSVLRVQYAYVNSGSAPLTAA
jgi:hypothetical protein